MMTERAFLIDLLLNDELPKQFKVIVGERIKELETTIQTAPVRPPVVMQVGQHFQELGPPNNAALLVPQSQSTLAALARQTGIALEQPQPVMVAPIVQKRIVGGEVNTGNGTRGPRKF